VIGLGSQGLRHTGLMKEFGTVVSAAVATNTGLTRVHETIPVYPNVAEMLRAHPHIAAVSIWKHFSSAAETALEAINANIPIVVLISEGMPTRDVRTVLAAARKQNTLLLGPNTPGLIFPPERVKIGMLPDIFQPAEKGIAKRPTDGVTICSRSGAILYHLSDALVSVGIAQNAVIGVGGDSAIGTPFPALVPMVMDYPGTDLVVVAGEIGGCQEELLAEDVATHPDRYPKPLVALISGRCAPEGKTMGHAGAIVSPGVALGTYDSKRDALESAGVTVVNSQATLIKAVRKALNKRTYFDVKQYYARMQTVWDTPPPKPTWNTAITEVAPNSIAVRGKPIASLIAKRSLLEVAALMITGHFPKKAELTQMESLALEAALLPVPRVSFSKTALISRALATMLLADKRLASFTGSHLDRTVYCLGRIAAIFSRFFGTRIDTTNLTFAETAHDALVGSDHRSQGRVRVVEAAMVASVDHGVTAPSAQATLIASSVRADFEASLAAGLGAITDIHGGAGSNAAQFYRACVDRAARKNLSLRAATEEIIRERSAVGQRIDGMGHRVHTHDPRRDALWKIARASRVAGPCVKISQFAEDAFASVRGFRLPINVDGVIGAVNADMGFDPKIATALFLFGRSVGLAAHHFEEITTKQPMRRIEFSQAVYQSD
jgi:succinyl-CoA synthetase alpha subunit